MAIPMYFLYEGGVVMARLMQKSRAKRAAEEEATEEKTDDEPKP